MSRFPYICYENGGGTFLLPYLVCLVLCGLPLYFMEMLLGQVTNHSTAAGHVTTVLTSDWLGQYAGSSCTKVFARLAPVMKGLGYGILSIPTMMTFYYTLIMSWAFYYMFQGCRHGCCTLQVSTVALCAVSRSVLPWRSCVSSVLADYTTQFCYSKWDNDQCVAENNTTIFYNKVKLLMDS